MDCFYATLVHVAVVVHKINDMLPLFLIGNEIDKPFIKPPLIRSIQQLIEYGIDFYCKIGANI